MTSPLVVTQDRPEALDPLQVGGKAANLARLERFGQPVPPWLAVTSTAFRRALRGDGLDRWIGERLAAATRTAEADRGELAEIRRRIETVDLPAEVKTAVARACEERMPAGAWLAVRSSALGEDAASDSFAGLHDSFLFVRGRDEVLAALRRVWASAFNDRAVAYRLSRGIPLDDIAVAVLVQEMVDAVASGVMFTVNPTNGSVFELVVSSLWGAGEGLVSVGLDADTFVVDKETLEAEEALAVKSEQLVLDREAGGGLRRVEVEAGRRERASLSPDQLLTVARAGLDIERAYGRPQDIELCFDREGRLFILQSRPVTTVEEYGPAAGNRLTWDNSNIIESYSGVTSPMTFSFIRHAYDIVYHCFTQVMGIHPDVVWRNRYTFQNMLGLFRGQVYYNLENWYRLIRMFPGFDYNRKFMESMMGVRESLDLDEGAAPAEPGWRRRYFVELPALLRLVARSVRNFARIRTIVGRFEEHFDTHYRAWSALDLEALQPHELMDLYREMEEKLLWNWKAPIINDFFVMIFYGTLKKLCVSWCGDESGSLQNDLICGEGGIASTEPTRRLLALAGMASRHDELRRLLLEEEPAKLAASIPSDPRFAEFAAGIGAYLDDFGFRCVDELKLEEHSLKERPAFLYQVIANYLRGADRMTLDPEAATRREAEIRRRAESRAFAALGRGLVPRRAIFRRVLANARLGVKNRENMRFARTRIYGLLREILRALGERLRAEGLLDAGDDIFYLTIDEVWDFIKGTAVTTDLRALVELRRAEFEGFRNEPERFPDDRFRTFGLAYHRNRFRARRPPAGPSEDGVLRGIGCCPGVVTGPVKVLRSPSEDARLNGEILVAERTDPGWVPLYPSVSGLLIERGSILSHSAIVAREMGIPTVVGIPGLSAALESGAVVTMDGSEGTVRPASS